MTDQPKLRERLYALLNKASGLSGRPLAEVFSEMGIAFVEVAALERQLAEARRLLEFACGVVQGAKVDPDAGDAWVAVYTETFLRPRADALGRKAAGEKP